MAANASIRIVDGVDCFDTLLFRYHGTPRDFYKFLERSFNIREFAKRREKAFLKAYLKSGQRPTRLDAVYAVLGQEYGWTKEKEQLYCKLEKDLDDMFLFRIETNIRQVSRNTIVTSDTFYTAEEVSAMLDKRQIPHGMVIASNEGKAIGCIWKNHPIRKSPKRLFLGDNMWSDVIMPAFHGVRGTHTKHSKRTYIEKMLHRNGFPLLSNWLRYIRLTGNPYDPNHLEFNIWNDQVEYNIPIMIWSCMEIHRLCQANKIQRILFVTRDCCHMKRFFDRIFRSSGYETIYFHCSRKVLENPPDGYVDYVKKCILPGKTMTVDLNGTGRSMNSFVRNHIPDCDLMTFLVIFHNGMNVLSKVKVYPSFYLIRQDIKHMDLFNGKSIEMLNYDLCGTLIGWKDGMPVRAEIEYHEGVAAINHEAVDYALEKIDPSILEWDLPDKKHVLRILGRYHLFGMLPKFIHYDMSFLDCLKRAKQIANKKYFQNSKKLLDNKPSN